nr:chalcone isomerase family protein [Comamonas testosteroni]
MALLGSAWSAPTNTNFPASVQLGGSTLQLNGKGTRHKAVFKVYEMALYLPRKVKSTEEVLALPGPKQIDFTAMRDLDTTDIGLAMVKGMRANATPEQNRKYLAASNQLVEIFSARRKLATGDRFGLQFTPGKGAIFMLNGVQQGEPLGNDEFFSMILKIWLGDSPAEPLLKDALLDN